MIESPYGEHLPIFPCLDYADITEERIERTVERLVDRADNAFMSGRCTEAQYRLWHTALDNWADAQYRKANHASA